MTHRSYVNCSFVFLIADPFKCSCVHLKRTKYQCITENALRRRQNRSRQQHLFKKFYSVSYATGRVSCVRLASRVELSGKVDFGARLSEIISERFDDDQRQQAAQVIDNYDRVWKTSDLTGRITRAIQLTESSLARAEQQRRSFQWLHDDILGLFLYFSRF